MEEKSCLSILCRKLGRKSTADPLGSPTSVEEVVINSSKLLKMSFQSQLETVTEITKSHRMALETEQHHPKYCYCERDLEGTMMIQCSNHICPWEWFHYKCVNISYGPKGKWYCPSCRSKTSSCKKKLEILMKQLDQYNGAHAEHYA